MWLPNVPCPRCGYQNEPGWTFCTNCGAALDSAGGPPPAGPPTYTALGSPAAPGPYPGAYPVMYPAPPRRATFSNILSGLFEVWSKNFLNFFVVFLVLALVNGLIGGLLAFAILGEFVGSGFIPGSPPTVISPGEIGLLVAFAVASLAISVIVNSVVVGGMTEYAVRRYRGESMSLEQALRRGFERFLSILGANILLTLLVFGLIFLPVLLILPVAFLGPGGDPGSMLALLCGGLVALAVGGIVALYAYVAMSLYAPAIMMESQGAVGGLTRSWAITKGYRWSIFGAILVAGILVAIISTAIVFPTSLLGNPFVDIVVAALASGIVGSWFVILAAVAYDLIVRPAPTVPPMMAPPMVPMSPPSPPSPPTPPADP